MKIVVLNECFLSDLQLTELGKDNEVSIFNITSTVQDAINRIKDADVIFVDQFVCPLTLDVLEKAENIKLIILNTTSYHMLDLEYLKSRNIVLCNTPNFCSESVAELVFMYTISLMRNIVSSYEDNSKKPFEIYPDELAHRKYLGNNLNEKTIGVIGLGNIGAKVCSIAHGFNMNVVGYNRTQKNIENVKNLGFDEVIKQSDILIITIPYTESSHHMINKTDLDNMKEGAVIINISSEDIVEEKSLIELLESGKIGGYGLDNFTNKDKNHFFYNSKSVMILPHLGFFTEESVNMIGTRMIEGYRGYLNNEKIHTIV